MKELEGARIAELSRKTNETDVYISLNLDGNGTYEINTGIPFFDHMLEQLGRHSGFDLVVKAQGDVQVDSHHTVEDVGIVLGQALYQCTRTRPALQDMAVRCFLWMTLYVLRRWIFAEGRTLYTTAACCKAPPGALTLRT